MATACKHRLAYQISTTPKTTSCSAQATGYAKKYGPKTRRAPWPACTLLHATIPLPNGEGESHTCRKVVPTKDRKSATACMHGLSCRSKTCSVRTVFFPAMHLEMRNSAKYLRKESLHTKVRNVTLKYRQHNLL